MKSLLEATSGAEIKGRIAQLQPNSERQWGRMSAAQALAHCTLGLKMALGDITAPRTLIGWSIGPILKKIILKDGEPMRPNSPTVKGLAVQDERNLEAERDQLYAIIDRLISAGPEGCTRHPHSLLGRLTPQEWGTLMYKHLDHHLRQFGA